MVIDFDKNRPTLSEFDRQCLEKIPPADMREIIAGAKLVRDRCQAWLDRDANWIPLDYEDFIRV